MHVASSPQRLTYMYIAYGVHDVSAPLSRIIQYTTFKTNIIHWKLSAKY